MSSTNTTLAKDPVKRGRRTIKNEALTEEARRQSTVASSTSSSAGGKDLVLLKSPKIQKIDAKAALKWEEDLVAKRTPKEDIDVHRKASAEIKKSVEEIHKLKCSIDPANEDEESLTELHQAIEETRIHGSLQFTVLKKLNRMSHLRCKKVRDSTNEAKQKIDLYHLQLQNLLYEAMHLEKEINKCLEFRSKDEDINLVSIEEFYKEAPSDISKPKRTKNDNHLQTLARLDWELEQRKQLAKKLKETMDMKEVITEEIKTKQEILYSLQPKLKSILDATKPTQEYLNMNFDEIREQHHTAHYLPTPLYVLYMQVTGYIDAYNKNLFISIDGDVEEAKIQANATSPDIEEESDVSDQEGEENQRKRKRRRKTVENRMSDKRKKMLSIHPLSVVVKMDINDSHLVLTFHYLSLLKIVTVKPTIRISADTSSSIAGGDLLMANTLLTSLYPGDIGDQTPNPSNNFQLVRLGMDKNIKSYVGEIGYPYIWVQWLAGLQFMEGVGDQKAQKDISATHMDDVIKKVQKRIVTRLSLQKQIAALEKGYVPVSSQHLNLFPVKINSRVMSWRRTTFADFTILPYAKRIVDAELVNEVDMIFEACIERGSAVITAHVLLSPDYPNQTPVITVNLHWKDECNSTNDENIRMIEAELNVYCSELKSSKSQDELLTNQIQRLLMLVDVYLEADSGGSSMDGPVEFPREKILPRVARGPDRVKPFCFISQLGLFVQR